MSIEKALQETLNEMQCGDEGLVFAVYNEDHDKNNAMVMLMELGKFPHVHAFMHDLYARLSNKLGHPVSLCHNHPTDENILIHGHKKDSELYDPNTCCRVSTIDSCMRYLETRTGYRPEVRALALLAESIFERLDPEDLIGGEDGDLQSVLESLDWNKDPIIELLKLDMGWKI